MFRKLIVLVCLLSFSPVAAGAQELVQLANAQPVNAQLAVEPSAEAAPPRELNLMPTQDRSEKIMVASNHLSGEKAAEAESPRRSHDGMTFKDFVDVHFGGYRWIYWAVAVAGIVAIHVVAAD